MINWMPLWAMVLAAAISCVLTACLLRLAPRLGFLDQPANRKVHLRPIPKGGGLAIYAACLLSQCIPEFRIAHVTVYLGFGTGIMLLGLIDDGRPLPWQFRLGAQAAMALAALAALGVFRDDVSGAFWLPWPLAWLWVVAMTNAFNMLDNMDALSAGTAWIVSALAAMFALGVDSPASGNWVMANAILCGALTGFLFYNWPPARIFMGDAGSTFLGFFLSLELLHPHPLAGDTVAAAGMALCLLAIPIYDMVTVVAIRLRQGNSPFHGDKQHLSHRLTNLGLSQVQAVKCILLTGAAIGISGMGLGQFLPWAALVTAAASWAVMLAAELIYRRIAPRNVMEPAAPAEHG